jgi:L-ornithine N5-oxygenase
MLGENAQVCNCLGAVPNYQHARAFGVARGRSKVNNPSHEGAEILDYIGVGFGPSNLALAIAFDEIAPHCVGLYFEQAPEIDWHGGLLFSHSRLQISFLKDLVTLRNPQSPFSFLSYLKHVGRLESFANLRELHPHRTEFLDYLRWVARSFAQQVRYNTRVVAVRPGGPGDFDYFIVETQELSTGRRQTYRAHNIIAATGGVPRGIDSKEPASGKVVHASRFLSKVPTLFPDRKRILHFVIAGDGQSAGETALELLTTYGNASIEILARGYSLHASDSTPFVNWAFSSDEADRFHAAPRERREAILQDLRSTNYGVINADVLEELYRVVYAAQISGREPLRVRPFSRLADVREAADGGGLTAVVADRVSGAVREVACDGVILATGYHRRLDENIFAEVIPLMQLQDELAPVTSSSFAVEFQRPSRVSVHVRGRARLLSDRRSIVSGLQSISEQNEHGSTPYRLRANQRTQVVRVSAGANPAGGTASPQNRAQLADTW